ncbi:spermidine synthase [Candidatus Omnitrophota bacterium]
MFQNMFSNKSDKNNLNRKMMLRLFAISFGSLFWEILLIRWIPSELPFLAFFRSLVLLACFLGLGIGCIAYKRIKLGNGSPVILFLTGIFIISLIISAGGSNLRSRGFGNKVGIFQQEAKNVAAQRDKPNLVDFTIEFEGDKSGGKLVIICTFILVSLTFIPMGIMLARCFSNLSPIPAYLINVLGALIGTLTFIGASVTMLSPPYWFLVGLAACWFILPRTHKWQAIFFTLSILLLGVIFYQNRHPNVIWSPYQRVEYRLKYTNLEKFPSISRKKALVEGPIYVNYDFHQCMVDYGFTNNREILIEVLKSFHKNIDRSFSLPGDLYITYHLPYFFCKPQNVLIIASGAGNEAAAALREDVEQIDAVEIDPAIIEIGRKFHPEQPYRDSRVNIICDDARAFLNRTDKKYDLIVMNQVDSHSQFASSANLRLDSYIYTVEFFEQVRRHLSPNGIFAMEFSGFHWHNLQWSRERMKEILWRVFGYTCTQQVFRGGGGPMFLITPAARPGPVSYNNNIYVSTDNWPQFYLRGPIIPKAYVRLIAYVLLITVIGVFIGNPKSLARIDTHFMFLGAAFMMFEIKSISELSLLFGSTWLINSLVIITILLAIAAANLVILKFKKIPYSICYVVIFISLILEIIFPANRFLSFSFIYRLMVSFLYVAVPIFGAGLVFATSFRRAIQPPLALGWNILGAIIGGLGEYLSLITGIRVLGFYILGLYVLSLITLSRSHLKINNLT